MSDKEEIGSYWEEGIDHEESSQKLVKMLDKLDWSGGDGTDAFANGGDGDPGEYVMYLLDYLLRKGKIAIEIKE